jgi:hypothetical protein
MLFNVKCAENFTPGSLFLYENVVANTFVKWTVFGSFLRLRFLQIENFDSKNSFQKGLRDMFMAEDSSFVLRDYEKDKILMVAF